VIKMPGLNGTGPEGKGPLTGRGFGKCFRKITKPGKIKLMSIAIPTVVALVDDIRRPDGITRRIYNTLKSNILSKSQKRITRNSDIYKKKITNKSKLEDS